jgi:hypothetical protein
LYYTQVLVDLVTTRVREIVPEPYLKEAEAQMMTPHKEVARGGGGGKTTNCAARASSTARRRQSPAEIAPAAADKRETYTARNLLRRILRLSAKLKKEKELSTRWPKEGDVRTINGRYARYTNGSWWGALSPKNQKLYDKAASLAAAAAKSEGSPLPTLRELILERAKIDLAELQAVMSQRIRMR